MLRTLDRRPDWQIACAITIALRLVYTGIAAVGAILIHPDVRLIHSNAFTANLPKPGNWHYALLGIWQRFDTLWYLRIAKRGYDLPAAVVFYPLYPWLIRGLSKLAGPIASALLVSTVAAFFYFWGLLRLARTESPHAPPLRTLVLATVWPASFFFFAGYTEALALALIVWSVASARDGRWALATGCAFAAGLTRSAGTLVIVPLAIMAWRTRPRALSALALAPLGTLGYWLWLRQTGRLSVAVAYQTYWNTQVAPPWKTLWFAIRTLAWHYDFLVMISLLTVVFFFIAGIAPRRRIEDKCFSAAVITHLLLRLCWPPLLGTPRYVLPMYPAYLTIGNWTEKMKPSRFTFLCASLFAFNLVWMWAFLSWSLVL